MKKCIIIGAGVCSAQCLSKQMTLQEGDLCIAADGGLKHLQQIEILPDIVLGDMDSIGLQELSGPFQIKRLPVEKDDTDMLAAIKEGLDAGYKQFMLYGALGGRLDHTLANIQCLLYLLNRGATGTIIGDDVILTLIKDTKISFTDSFARKGRRISVFAYGGDAYGVCERGLKYLLDSVTVKQEFPIGISNEFTGESAEVEVRQGMLLICIEQDKWEESV